MQKVWLCWADDWGKPSLVRIVATREAAEKWIPDTTAPDERWEYRIEEWEVELEL